VVGVGIIDKWGVWYNLISAHDCKLIIWFYLDAKSNVLNYTGCAAS
jgi:hypothetical protein